MTNAKKSYILILKINLRANQMKKILNIISAYQLLFGLLGLVLIISFTAGKGLSDHLIGIGLFFISILSGVLLFIKKSQNVGFIASIINNTLQSVIFIFGNVWYQYQSGLAIGFGYHKFMRNEWVGSRKNLILNIGANYRLMFNDNNTELYIGINLWAIFIVVVLVILFYKNQSMLKSKIAVTTSSTF